MFSLVVGGFATRVTELASVTTALLLMKKGCYSLGALAARHQCAWTGSLRACLVGGGTRFWWRRGRGFEGRTTSQPVFHPDPRPMLLYLLTLPPAKPPHFSMALPGPFLCHGVSGWVVTLPVASGITMSRMPMS